MTRFRCLENELLAESAFVAVCCQWTAETTRLIGTAAFEAMAPETILVNVARGEIIDEAVLLAALQSGKPDEDAYTGWHHRRRPRRAA